MQISWDGTAAVDGIITIPLSGQPLGCNCPPDGDLQVRSPLCQFLAGPENRLVEVAVRSVLDGPIGGGYNPLLIYGHSGTGKSHIARGLDTQWRANYPRLKCIYTTAVDFARELTDALDSQGMDEVRAKYRTAALLVFEDLAWLAGRTAAQEELVCTLDILLASNKQVVVTASCPPGQLPGIRPSLQSRLVAGLTVPLALPSSGARLAILRQLSRLRRVKLAESVARTLADGLAGTVPELLGALVQLEMAARLDGGRIDAEAVRCYLARRHTDGRPPLRQIAAATARHFSLKLSELRSRSQRRAVVTARGVAMYLARQFTGNSLQQIGRYFGDRDHSTVMHGCRKTETLLSTDPAIRQAVRQLQQKW